MADLFLMSRKLQCNLHKILNKTVILWRLKVVMCLAVAYLGHQFLFIVVKYSFIILQLVLKMRFEAACSAVSVIHIKHIYFILEQICKHIICFDTVFSRLIFYFGFLVFDE